MSADVNLQAFREFLLAEEEKSARRLIENLNLLWAIKQEKVDLVKLPKDILETSLIPDDIHHEPDGHHIALQATEMEIAYTILSP